MRQSYETSDHVVGIIVDKILENGGRQIYENTYIRPKIKTHSAKSILSTVIVPPNVNKLFNNFV